MPRSFEDSMSGCGKVLREEELSLTSEPKVYPELQSDRDEQLLVRSGPAA